MLSEFYSLAVYCPSPSIQFGSLPALLAAAAILSDVDSISDSGSGSGVDGNKDSDVTRSEVGASAGFVIAIAALAILLSLLWVIIRFCNIGLVNLKIRNILIVVSMVVNLSEARFMKSFKALFKKINCSGVHYIETLSFRLIESTKIHLSFV